MEHMGPNRMNGCTPVEPNVRLADPEDSKRLKCMYYGQVQGHMCIYILVQSLKSEFRVGNRNKKSSEIKVRIQTLNSDKYSHVLLVLYAFILVGERWGLALLKHIVGYNSLPGSNPRVWVNNPVSCIPLDSVTWVKKKLYICPTYCNLIKESIIVFYCWLTFSYFA